MEIGGMVNLAGLVEAVARHYNALALMNEVGAGVLAVLILWMAGLGAYGAWKWWREYRRVGNNQ